MKIDDYISEHPFPEDGENINNALVVLYKRETDGNKKRRIVEKIIENNIRLISFVQHKYHYEEYDLGELAGIFAESVYQSLRTFDLKYLDIKNSVSNHLIIRFRSNLQGFVRKFSNPFNITRKERELIASGELSKPKKTDSDALNYIAIDDILDDTNNLDYVLDEMMANYEKSIENESDVRNLKLLRMYKDMTFGEIRDANPFNENMSTSMIAARVHKAYKNIRTYIGNEYNHIIA